MKNIGLFLMVMILPALSFAASNNSVGANNENDIEGKLKRVYADSITLEYQSQTAN